MLADEQETHTRSDRWGEVAQHQSPFIQLIQLVK